MEEVERLLRLIGRCDRRLKPCKKHLVVERKGKAIFIHGSYNNRCGCVDLMVCANCRHYENVKVLLPEKVMAKKSREELVEYLTEITWGHAREAIVRYVIPNIDRIMELRDGDSLRLI